MMSRLSARSAEGELTLLEHLQELRQRLMVASIALVLAIGASLYFTSDIIRFLAEPARDQVPDFKLIFTEPMGYIGAYFRVSLLAGVTLAMPIMAYEGLMFVLPGLTPKEKRWLLPVVLGAGIAFALGVAFGFYVVLPPALKFLFTFGEGTAQPFIRINSYIDFVTRMLLASGLTFETPILVMAVARFGLVTAGKLLRWWRYAIVVAFVVAAIITPSIDPVTQGLVAGPIIVLYGVGIGLAWLVRRPRAS
ncbi:MAG TPA: twin-arginine translocase subunit TatC [Dehalococcoidia bacterium]|nr:twin-arginine translocase subunit TatC [Dehalococcoidia bacterium]